MRPSVFSQVLRVAIAVFLGMIALRPLFTREPVRAQGEPQRFYVEPGVTPCALPTAAAKSWARW